MANNIVEETYTKGLSFKTTKEITKNDIFKLCNLLNNRDEYKDICTFTPEGITEGGIKYNFINNDKFYKSIRFGIYNNGICKGEWYWVNENVMTEWNNNDDIIFPINDKFSTHLKAFHGAPVFTIDELKVIEECFNKIGIKRVGRYMAKKHLITRDRWL